ncbi:RNA polymerase sigma factor [Dethiosulfatarculus sandiegensis]|uniref:RNA polymerase sigma-70 region 2 domain-containing protein n=1 Tax=Dethiosulfatarculus sandiegensis TaxID=1429043 RepID=A0A0D2G8K2_9BACT|nr:sigma-70 family RNA polymerase sigma factor [Dethiosulfatarculus sandiegensis]KIX11262.1 hypothetical protein X474_26110 [Dethiosulfatarculus sandiegensis]
MDYEALTDQKLLRICLEGDSGAWREFVRRFSGLVFHSIKATLLRFEAKDRDQELARDLFQETFLALCEDNYRKLRIFKGKNGCSLATWLRVLTSRLVIDYLRKKKLPQISLDSYGKEFYGQGNNGLKIPDSRPPPLELLQEKEIRIFLDELLDELKPREKLAIQLRFKDGLSGEKTAMLLKMNRNHLNQIIHRVKKSLREKAEEKGFL